MYNKEKLNLLPGQYINVKSKIEGKDIERSYSPVNKINDPYVELMIKNEGGIMSNHITNMKIGQTLDFKGPIGGFEYKKNMYKNITLIAGIIYLYYTSLLSHYKK